MHFLAFALKSYLSERLEIAKRFILRYISIEIGYFTFDESKKAMN